MLLKSLTAEQYRGFSSRTTFDFHPAFTVIVGENGVGKTSVLWALRVLLSHTIARLVKKPVKRLLFQTRDIAKAKDQQRDWPFLRAESIVFMEELTPPILKCVAQKNAASFVPSGKDGLPREHAVSTPDLYEMSQFTFGNQSGTRQKSAPLVVYYSAHRSIALERGTSAVRAVGGAGSAYAEALEDRELRLGEAAELWRAEAALAMEGRPPAANRAIEKALPAFLGGFQNLRVEGGNKPRLVVNKNNRKLDLGQLSDGERGLLTILIDLTRRLAQANPSLKNPAREGQAIVLIDELDLHMHPGWQRKIVSLLRTTFPKCQFVTTTHSPQIISEIQPESLLLLRKEGDRIVPEGCGQAYGLDTNYVLEHIMGTASRAKRATGAIRSVEEALEYGDLLVARKRLERLRTLLHGDDTVVVRLEATINNLEALSVATHKKKK